MSYRQYRVVFIVFLLLVSAYITGCNGLRYEFTSFESYEAGQVLNAPETSKYEAYEPNLEANTLQIFAVGDTGAENEGQRIVSRQMAAWARTNPIDFVLFLGDNFYGRGVKSILDEQWKTKFEDIYYQESLQIPFYAVLGNHDYYKNPEAQVDYSLVSKRWKMPSRFYQFTKKIDEDTAIDFFALDTESLLRGNGEGQLEWLEQGLKKSKAHWKIVFSHHPLYSGGKKRKETLELRTLLELLLVKYGVDLYVSGHNHSVELTKPIAGVRYLVSGAGARPRDVYWGEHTQFADAELGFAWLIISKDKIDVNFINNEENVLFSHSFNKKVS